MRRLYMRLPHNETEESRRYSMPDPDELIEAYAAVRYHHYNKGAPEPTEAQRAMVIALAQGYLELTTYELGQECCVEKLRDIWRARRAGK